MTAARVQAALQARSASDIYADALGVTVQVCSFKTSRVVVKPWVLSPGSIGNVLEPPMMTHVVLGQLSTGKV